MMIDEIRERAKKATKGPWVKDMYFSGGPVNWFIKQPKADHRLIAECRIKCHHSMDNHPKDDYDFIAHSRTDIPYLLALVDEAIPVIEQLLDSMDEYYATLDEGIACRNAANELLKKVRG